MTILLFPLLIRVNYHIGCKSCNFTYKQLKSCIVEIYLTILKKNKEHTFYLVSITFVDKTAHIFVTVKQTTAL
jgi:hypothetical protein